MESSISRKELEKEARKQDILEAAVQLFAQKDFHSVTVDEIADSVGLAKGTIYLYFETKENLFFSILIENTKTLMKALNHAVQLDIPFESALRQFVMTFLVFTQKHEAYFKLLHSEKTRSSMEARYKMHDYANEIIGEFMFIITRLLNKGVAEKYIRSIEINSMAKMLAGLLNTFTFYRIFENATTGPEQVTEQIIDLFLNGVKRKS